MVDNKIAIYQTPDGQISIDVKLENESVWLSAPQMSLLFDRDEKTVRKHINNAVAEELSDAVVVAKFATTTQHGAIKGKLQTREVNYYNLDVVISVGYRVKSKQGVDFRRWANRILKEYLIKGYAINNKVAVQRYDELKKLIHVLGRTVHNQEILQSDEATGLINVVSDYAYALDTLDKYDYQQLNIEQTTSENKFWATYENAMQTIAAILLYLVTKNHSFSDGNKRIAAALFLWFLANNGILYNADGTKRIADNTLVALTLMIAESRTEEMDTMIKVVVNLINKQNT